MEGKLTYGFLRNRKNTEPSGEGSKEEGSSKIEKHKSLKGIPLHDVTLKGLFRLPGVGETEGGF